MHQSYILIRLKRSAPRDVFACGRRIRRHGQFGNLHAVEKSAALQLIDSGLGKLLPHMDLARLRREVSEPVP